MPGQQKYQAWVMNRLNTWTIDEFVNLFPEKINHKRLKVFFVKGFSCVQCGVTAVKVIEWNQLKKSPGMGTHIDFVAIRPSGKEVMMTVDHIKPKAKGGTRDFHNLQPMCSICNHNKADTYGEEEDLSLLAELLLQVGY